MLLSYVFWRQNILAFRSLNIVARYLKSNLTAWYMVLLLLLPLLLLLQLLLLLPLLLLEGGHAAATASCCCPPEARSLALIRVLAYSVATQPITAWRDNTCDNTFDFCSMLLQLLSARTNVFGTADEINWCTH